LQSIVDEAPIVAIVRRPKVDPVRCIEHLLNSPSINPSFDVVTFGEAMVLFAPAERGTLEWAPAYHGSIEGPSPIARS
jgi:hypothetical protein